MPRDRTRSRGFGVSVGLAICLGIAHSVGFAHNLGTLRALWAQLLAALSVALMRLRACCGWGDV
jgi:hypothetical protein